LKFFRKVIYLNASRQAYDAEKNIEMSYTTQAIAASLKEARASKGLSQRDLSLLAGVPQAQISRIEAGTVDPRATSLIALAHALDMELALVPRKALPAVKSITRQSNSHDGHSIGPSLREVNRIAELLRNMQVTMPHLDEITRLQKTFADLQRFQLPSLESDALKSIRKSLDMIKEPSRQIEALARSQDEMQKLRNYLAHRPLTSKQDRNPKPAYSLDEDDDA
jgi:transcriptional regulator with XRE-family HTH domain